MKKYRTLLFMLSILAITWTAFTPATSFDNDWQEKISPQLMTKALRGESLDFLVMLQEQADISAAKQLKTKIARGNYVFHQLQKHAKNNQKNIIQFLTDQNATFRAFFVINAIQVKGDATLLQALAEHPEVRLINDNSPVKVETPVEMNFSNERGPNAIEWGIDMMDAEEVWAMGVTGENVIVGGQDTGYDWTHPALSSTYRGNQGASPDHNYNWHDAIREIDPLHNDPVIDPSNNPCGLDVPYPCDDNNHGTHTMGTMVGEDGDNQIGVAPGSQWIACRNMERGWGKPSTYIECFEWFIAPTDLQNENPDPSKAPHVIANSWGCPEVEGCDSTNWHVMEQVVENLKASGVVVVVSAGNSGSNCGSVQNPASIFEASFSIGATNQNDTIAGFSSRGAVTVDGSGLLKPNVSAPGTQVRSCIRDSSYASFSGTSMAGPHVAGVVALMISANPDLAGQVEVIEDILEQTAIPKTSEQECNGVSGNTVPNNTFGYGRVDALAAVTEAMNTVSTSEKEIEKTTISVFPNPTTGLVSLEINNLVGNTQLDLFSSTGQLLQTLRWNLSEYELKNISLNSLPQGVYFYKIRNEEVELTGKIFKQ